MNRIKDLVSADAFGAIDANSTQAINLGDFGVPCVTGYQNRVEAVERTGIQECGLFPMVTVSSAGTKGGLRADVKMHLVDAYLSLPAKAVSRVGRLDPLSKTAPAEKQPDPVEEEALKAITTFL